MRDTYYLHEAATPLGRVASLYVGTIGSWTNFWTPDSPFYPYAWGSQSLFSSPTDYAKFLAMLLDKGTVNGEQILSEAAVARILDPISVMSSLGSTAPHPTGFSNSQYYYGQVSVLYQSAAGLQVFGHSGSDGTWAWAWPEQDLMIFYFTQSRGQATGIRLETEFDRLLLNPGIQPAPEIVERYAPYLDSYQANMQSVLGAFSNEEFAVVIHNDRLGLDIPGQFIFQLKDALPGRRWYSELSNELSIAFDQDSTDTVTGLRFYEPGQLFRLPRIKECPTQMPFLIGAEWLHTSPDNGGGSTFSTQSLGTANCRYVIEYSENLVDWNPLQTNLVTGIKVEITDRDAAGVERRFYRARVAGY